MILQAYPVPQRFVAFVFSFCSLFFLTLPAGGQDLDAVLQHRLIEELDQYSSHRHLTSLSFTLFRGDSVYFDYARGYANVATKARATPEHIYTIASVTKPITAMTLLQLVFEGRLSLADEVDTIIAGFPANVTIKDLLNHTSGFLREKESEQFLSDSDYRDVVRYQPVKFNLKIHRYANYNYAAAGAVIEAVSGQPFARVSSNYYRSITGDSLYFRNHSHSPRNRKFVTNYVRKRRRLLEHEVIDFGLWESAAFAQTSSRSLAGFLRHHMMPEFIDFLEQHAVPIEPRRDRTSAGTTESYSLGFRLRYVDGELEHVFHNGFLYGVMATLYYFPKRDFGFAALSNMSTYPRQTISLGGLYRHVEHVVDRLFNDRLVRFTEKNGLVAGAVYYETHRREGQADETLIDAAAQENMDAGNALAALHLLKLNNYLFPKSKSTYQSLAAAYFKMGKRNTAADILRKGILETSEKISVPDQPWSPESSDSSSSALGDNQQ